MCAFQSMKSVEDGIARCNSHNDLAGTNGDFFLPQSYTYIPPPLKNTRNIIVHYPLLTFRKVYSVD